MPHLLLTVTIPPERLEQCLALLGLAGMLGCEEEERAGDVTVRAYFPGDTDPRELVEHVRAACDNAEMQVEHTADQDWHAQWRASVQPVKITDTIWTAPSWRTPEMAEGECWIRIEPATAFGTGHHETTRLAASLVSQCVGSADKPPTVLDIGAGSGILCFCARLCGAAWCVGVEIDPPALRNMADNRRDNPSLDRADFLIGTTAALRSDMRFDMVVMNMLLRRSAPLLPEVARLIVP
ncbi:MAG: methyltransferase domain-containing protein, partial [Chitinivibrionales bacterium]|nr:methyltransferase domain-containing protein [Chitinivibrionales bacterium]